MHVIGGMPGMGSSPLTRGALFLEIGDRSYRGIIPAYAGSTKIVDMGSSTTKDHPRLRGEHDAPACSHARG